MFKLKNSETVLIITQIIVITLLNKGNQVCMTHNSQLSDLREVCCISSITEVWELVEMETKKAENFRQFC